MNVDSRPRSLALTLSEVVLALAWIFAGLTTAALALLLTQPLAMPECTSYDTAGQRVGQVGALITIAVMIALWVVAVVLLRRSARTPITRLALGVGLPIAIGLAFITGGMSIGAAVETVAPNADHATCW